MICLACGFDKDENDFPRDSRRPTGRHPYCKKCKADKERVRQKEKRDSEFKKLIETDHRTCWTCRQSKHYTEFDQEVFLRRSGYISCNSCLEETKQRAKEQRKTYERRTYNSNAFKNRYQLTKDKLAEHRIQNKLLFLKLLGNKCHHCGLEVNNENPVSLFDFHHTDPTKKDINISRHLKKSKNSLDKVFRELEKCIILCSNCHRKEHFLTDHPCNFEYYQEINNDNIDDQLVNFIEDTNIYLVKLQDKSFIQLTDKTLNPIEHKKETADIIRQKLGLLSDDELLKFLGLCN